MSDLFLTDEDLFGLTQRKRRDAQVKVLRFLGINHRVRPDGSIAILKEHVAKELGGTVEKKKVKRVEPDWSGVC